MQKRASKMEKLPEDVLADVAGGVYTGPVFMYVIQPGDSLARLAHRYGTTVQILAELNHLTDDPQQIRAGRTIMIPQK